MRRVLTFLLVAAIGLATMTSGAAKLHASHAETGDMQPSLGFAIGTAQDTDNCAKDEGAESHVDCCKPALGHCGQDLFRFDAKWLRDHPSESGLHLLLREQLRLGLALQIPLPPPRI